MIKFQKEIRKNRRLELKAEHTKQQLDIELLYIKHANQQQLTELQELEMQKGF